MASVTCLRSFKAEGGGWIWTYLLFKNSNTWEGNNEAPAQNDNGSAAPRENNIAVYIFLRDFTVKELTLSDKYNFGDRCSLNNSE